MGHVAVEVDRTAILAEAAAVAAESPQTAPAPTGELGQAAPALDQNAAPPAPALDPVAKAAEVAPAVRFLVAQVVNLTAPNWQVTPDECNGIGDAAAMVLAYWMPPDAIDPKYMAVMSLAGAVWAVAAKRRDDDGNWRPLRAAKAPAPAEGAPARAPADAPAPGQVLPARAAAPLRL